MTIKFIADYPPFKIGQTTSLSPAEETALVAQKVAVTDLNGGTPYVPSAVNRLGSAIAQLLSKFQIDNGAAGLAAVNAAGKIIGIDGKEVSIPGTVGFFKPWPSAGANISSFVSENSSSTGTTYSKQKLSGNPQRAMPIILHKYIRTPEAYSQTGTAVVISTTNTKGIVAGDLVFVYPTTGNGVAGFYPVASTVDGVSVTYTAEDSQTTSGNMSWSKKLKGVKVAAALTESSANVTLDNLVTPTVGGVSYNSAYSTANPYGFQTVDFNSSAIGNPNNFGSAQPAKIAIAQNSQVSYGKAGQWISLPQVISDDGKGANFLYRVYHDTANQGSHTALSGLELIMRNNSVMRSTLSLDSNPWFRTNWQIIRTGVDGIASPTTLPTNTNAGTGFAIGWVFDYGVPSVSVAVITDSTGAHNKYLFDYGPCNAFTANVTGSTLTLTSDATATGVAIPYPLSPGQVLTFTGQTNHADGCPVFITGLISGQPGKTGAVYSLSIAQSTLNGVSVTPNLSVNLGVGTSWGNKAVYDKSTPALPYDILNCGMAGHRSHEYLPQVGSLLENGFVPSIVALQGWSTNNDSASPTAGALAEEKARLLNAIKLCRQFGVKKVLVLTWPKTGAILNNPTFSANIDEHNAWIRSLYTSGITDGCPDFEGVRTALGHDIFYSPDGTLVNSVFGDKVHPGQFGCLGMANEFSKWI